MDEAQARNRAGSLLKTQKLAVLATNKNGHPYCSLVAIAATADLKYLIFCARSCRRI